MRGNFAGMVRQAAVLTFGRGGRDEGGPQRPAAAPRKSSEGQQRLRTAAEGERRSSDCIRRSAASVALLPPLLFTLLLLFLPLPLLSPPLTHQRAFLRNPTVPAVSLHSPDRPARHLLLPFAEHTGLPHAAGAGSGSGNSCWTHLTGGWKEGRKLLLRAEVVRMGSLRVALLPPCGLRWK